MPPAPTKIRLVAAFDVVADAFVVVALLGTVDVETVDVELVNDV